MRLEDHYQLGDSLDSCLVESKMDDTSCWSIWRPACDYWSLPYHACLPDRNGIVAGRIDAAGAGLNDAAGAASDCHVAAGSLTCLFVAWSLYMTDNDLD